MVRRWRRAACAVRNRWPQAGRVGQAKGVLHADGPETQLAANRRQNAGEDLMAICTEPAQVISTFVAAYRACDVDALTALYEEDATVYDIDGTCRGLAEIRKMWQAFANQFEVLDYRIDEREEQVVGEYAFGHMTMTARAAPAGDHR